MKYVLAIVLSASFLLAPQARAGEAGEALSKCLSDATTPDDRRALVRWIFAAIAAHPDLKEFTTIGTEGFQAAFKTLGELAMGGVVRRRIPIRQGLHCADANGAVAGREDAQVQASMARLGERIDEQRILQALLTQ
jgi:hypothetical protein